MGRGEFPLQYGGWSSRAWSGTAPISIVNTGLGSLTLVVQKRSLGNQCRIPEMMMTLPRHGFMGSHFSHWNTSSERATPAQTTGLT